MIVKVSVALAAYEICATTFLAGRIPTITTLSVHRWWRYPVVAYPLWLLFHFAQEARR